MNIVSDFQRNLAKVAAWVLIVLALTCFIFSSCCWIYYGGAALAMVTLINSLFFSAGILLLRFIKSFFL